MQHLSLILVGSTKLWQHPKSLLKMKLSCTLSVCMAMDFSKLLLSLKFAISKSISIGGKGKEYSEADICFLPVSAGSLPVSQSERNLEE